MPLRIELDFSHGATFARVERSAEGALHLVLIRAQDTVVLQMTYPSLEALSWQLLASLPALFRRS
jgi:hypothetical protein